MNKIIGLVLWIAIIAVVGVIYVLIGLRLAR